MKPLWFVVALLASSRTSRADDVEPYVIQEGDTCLGIAIRIVGERSAVAQIHRLNPQLGPLPHRLVAGMEIRIPAHQPSGPDARVTRTTGDVKIRKPSTVTWDAASRGMDLFRAYRVGAASQASAELTFADAALLRMRERTIVVIYGPERRLAKLITATADLERGTLESRLGELDGKPVVVRTNAATAEVRANEVVITANDGGPSVVSNHGGTPVALRGRTKQPGRVSVAAGMGTRVIPGRVPEPPRPLPATPIWSTTSGPKIISSSGSIELAWEPVARATMYRVAISSNGDLIAASVLTAPTTRLSLALAEGTYQVAIAAFDADGLESVPSPPLDLGVVALRFEAPNKRVATSRRTPDAVVVGTAVTAPAGMTCSVGNAPAARIVFDRPGPAVLRCTTPSGGSTEPRSIMVVAVREAAPAGVVASVQAPPRRPSTYLGAYTGYHSVAVRSALAFTGDDGDALDDGMTVGLRGGVARRDGIGVELELGFSMLDHRDSADRVTAFGTRVHAVYRHAVGRSTLQVLGGGGVTHANGEWVPTVSWGGAATVRVINVDLRGDLHHEIGPGDGVRAAHALQATLGASFDLPW